MSYKMKSLQEQLEAFKNGVIMDENGESDDCYNFWDWFCKKPSLKNKALSLFPKVQKFVDKYPHKLDLSKCHVTFKNNCPMNGSLYDDFRICDNETRDVIYTVTPKSGFDSTKGEASIWGNENNFKEAIKTANKYSELFI